MERYKNYIEHSEKTLGSFKSLVESILQDDSKGMYPSELKRYKDETDIYSWIVPEKYNGKLKGFEEVFFKARSLSRRNITSAIAFGQCLLGSLSVWISGDEKQQSLLASRLLEGGNSCLALTELNHGSDLSSTEVFIDDKLKLSGSKWCINNATIGTTMVVLANSKKGLTAVFIDKNSLDKSSFDYLERLKTHGIRGADISGIKFNKAQLTDDAILLRKGKGLDIVAKSLQVSRTLCSVFSLGATDSCLRMGIDFLENRQLYGKKLKELNSPSTLIQKSFLRHMFCEGLSLIAIRSISMEPQALSINSALIKYIIPTVSDTSIRYIGEVLGARSFINNEEYPLFEKFKRDHSVVGLFDGSSAVNLSIIARQANHIRKQLEDETIENNDELYDLNIEDKTFSGEGLKLSPRGADIVFKHYRAVSSELPDYIRSIIDSEISSLIKLFELDIDPESYQSRKVIERYCTVTGVCIYINFYLKNKSFFNSQLQEDSFLYDLVTEMLNPDKIDYSNIDMSEYVTHSRLFSHFDLVIKD